MAKSVEVRTVRRNRSTAGTTREGGNKQITLLLTPKQFRKMDVTARKARISFAEAVRRAVDNYVA